MRDPARIPIILDLLKQAWEIDEDMRFMQLIFNLQANYSQKNNNIGLVERIDKEGSPARGFDLFNTEDDEIERFLKKYIEERSDITWSF